MTKDEALKMAMKALEANQPVNYCMNNNGEKFPMMQEDPFRFERNTEAITAIKEVLVQPEPKYHRGNRLICLETEEYCVIHISGTDRQWVKFPDSYIGVYTNEQVAELFELLPKETEQEPVATLWQHGETGRTRITMPNDITDCDARWFKAADLYTTPPQRTWVGLTDEDIKPFCDANHIIFGAYTIDFVRAIEAKLKEKNVPKD